MKAAAAADLANPTEAAAQLALANLWWEAAKGAAAPADALRRRAGTWYEKALPGLTDDLEKVLAQKRLAELAAASAPPVTPASKTPSAPPPPSFKKGDWIDLLALVDLGKDPSVGEWKRVGNALGGTGIGAFGTPFALPGSYDVEVIFLRTQGGGAMLFYVPCAGKAVRLVVGNGGVGGGLTKIDGKVYGKGPAWLPSGQITNGRVHTLGIRVLVGTGAEITVVLDGKPYVHWRGSPSSLSPGDEARDLHDHRIFACGREKDNTSAIQSLRLRVLSGDVTPVRPLAAAAPVATAPATPP
jgi:hypothetical protein